MATETMMQRERIPSAPDIMIGLVDEAGLHAPVEIDETDEELRHSIDRAPSGEQRGYGKMYVV